MSVVAFFMVSCIVTVCGRYPAAYGLISIVLQLKNQTYKETEIIPIVCCIEHLDFIQPILGVAVHEIPHDDAPHPQYAKNTKGLELATGGYIGFFAGDDYYAPDYLEKMIEKAQEADSDIVYCNFRSHYAQGQEVDGFIEMGHVTNGSFLIRIIVAKKVGAFPRTGMGDIEFLLMAVANGATSVKVPETLYVHI
jgi:hypothetical protein